MFKKTLTFLFTPRTDSPTKAYYAGLVTGAWFSYEIYRALDQHFAEKELEEAQARHDAALEDLWNQAMDQIEK